MAGFDGIPPLALPAPRMSTQKIRFIDATLREGNQAPGTTFSPEQTLEIAKCLADAGVDMIECGHPSVSENERLRLQAILDCDFLQPILAHARCCETDIDAVARAGVPWVGMFLGLNAISQLTRVRKPVEHLIDLIRAGVCARFLRCRMILFPALATRAPWSTIEGIGSVH